MLVPLNSSIIYILFILNIYYIIYFVYYIIYYVYYVLYISYLIFKVVTSIEPGLLVVATVQIKIIRKSYF